MPTEKELMLKQSDAETTYQKKLTAGTNITIDPVTNVISSAGGGSTVQYTDNTPNGESVGILAINGQSHPIRIPRLSEGSGITINKDITTNVYTISLSGGGGGTTKTYMGETNPDELVGEDGDLYFKYHKITTVIPTELTLPTLPDDTVVPFPITNFNSYDSFTFYCTDPSLQTTTINLNIGDIPIGDNPAELTPESEIHRFNTFYYAQVSRSTDGEGLVFRVGRNVLFKLEANVTEVDLGIDKSYTKVEDTWVPSGEQVEANPEETSETPLTKIKIDGVTYYIAAGGTNVIPNPEGTPTEELHSIQIDEDIYEIVGGGGSGGNASLDAITLYDTPITTTGTYTLTDDYNNYDFIGFKAGNGSTETDIRLYAVKDIQDSMNDNLVITNNVTNSWFNFTINENELTIPGKTVSTIYSVIGYKIKGGGGGSTVVPNPEEEPTDTLNTIEIDGVVYNIEGSSEGEGVEIYSEDEYIVGKWIDGKKLYQRTIYYTHNDTIGDGYTTIASLSDADYFEFVECSLYNPTDKRSYALSYAYGSNTTALTYDNGDIKLRVNSDTWNANWDVVITVRYTKTVETPAPAWGGSVTNNYAGFIDADNVIYSTTSSSNTDTYTATEDCYIMQDIVTGSTVSTVNVDGETVAEYLVSGTQIISYNAFLKKGQVLTVTHGGTAQHTIKVFGITYASGGSSSGSSVKYSTDEQEIGTWIDGSKLYEKTIYAPTISGTGSTTIDSTLNLSNTNFILVESMFYKFNGYVEAVNMGFEVALMPYGVAVYVDSASSSYRSGITDMYVTIRYTKAVS